MFHIFDKYYMDVDKYSYVIGVAKEYTRKGKTECVLKDPAYYSTMHEAIAAVRKRVLLEGLQGMDGELKDAVNTCKRLSDNFTEVLEKATKDIDTWQKNS